MITGFNHTGFVVKDLTRMVDFYRDTLGLTVVRERESMAPESGDHTGIPGAHRMLVFVGRPEGSHVLELVHYIDPPSPAGHLTNHQLGSAHVAFNVQDLAGLYGRLSAAGVPFMTPPLREEVGPGRLVNICYGQDPEGNWLEFIEAL